MQGIALVTLAVIVGCYAYRSASLPPAPGAEVRVILTTPTAVTSIVPGREGERLLHDGVLEASGVVRAAAADTIALRLGELRTAAGRVRGTDGRVALIPVARVAKIMERRFEAGRTALGGAGLLTLATSAFIILITITLTRAAR